jgi:hypothetical protein
MTSIYLSARFPQFFLLTAVFGGSNPDGGTIGGQLYRALRINLQKVENRPINDKCPAVAMFDEILEHLQVSNGVDTTVTHCSTNTHSCQKESTIAQELVIRRLSLRRFCPFALPERKSLRDTLSFVDVLSPSQSVLKQCFV